MILTLLNQSKIYLVIPFNFPSNGDRKRVEGMTLTLAHMDKIKAPLFTNKSRKDGVTQLFTRYRRTRVSKMGG